MSDTKDTIRQMLDDAAVKFTNPMPDLRTATDNLTLRAQNENLKAENTKLKTERRRWFRLVAMILVQQQEVRLTRHTQTVIEDKVTIVATDDPATGELVLRIKA